MACGAAAETTKEELNGDERAGRDLDWLTTAMDSIHEAQQKLGEAYGGRAAFDVVKDKSRAVRLQAIYDEIYEWLSEMDSVANPDLVNI